MVKPMSKSKARAGARTKTVAYDVAEHLRTPEEMAAYLDAWLEEAPDDAGGIARALGDIARAKGMTQVARDSGLSRESLYKALSETGNPSLAAVLKVARRLASSFMRSPLELRSMHLQANKPGATDAPARRPHREPSARALRASFMAMKPARVPLSKLDLARGTSNPENRSPCVNFVPPPAVASS